eukprot:1622978-Pyramimonas_sp.AAC.1
MPPKKPLRQGVALSIAVIVRADHRDDPQLGLLPPPVRVRPADGVAGRWGGRQGLGSRRAAPLPKRAVAPGQDGL